ncbi:hypothetical protein ACOMHN_025045 [Nucella lapillus]
MRTEQRSLRTIYEKSSCDKFPDLLLWRLPPMRKALTHSTRPRPHDVTAALQNELSKRLEQVDFTKGQTEENWAKFRNEVYAAAKETIGTLKRHHQDWFDDNESVIRSLHAEKYAAHKNWLVDIQSDSRQDKFHHIRREVQKRLHSMKDEWWKKKAEEIQGYADSKKASVVFARKEGQLT